MQLCLQEFRKSADLAYSLAGGSIHIQREADHQRFDVMILYRFFYSTQQIATVCIG